VAITTIDKEVEAALEAEAGVASPTVLPPATINLLPVQAPKRRPSMM